MNRLFTALALSVLSSLIFSQHAFANRPAMEESETSAEAEPNTVDSQLNETSSVDIMMQQETQQTGDIVQLPPVEMQPGETIRLKLLDSPRRGASMEKVKNELGQPLTVSDSVGQPPITRWIYPDRVVYFEHSTVLHVVAQ